MMQALCRCGATARTGGRRCELCVVADRQAKLECARRLYASTPRVTRPCSWCDAPMPSPDAWQRWCSNSCREARQRASTLRARYVGRGCDPAYAELIDPIAVFEAHGWSCHWCGCSTPQVLRGGNDPRAPEISHVDPISMGGQHVRANVVDACRRCNGERFSPGRSQK